ncbi:MAG: uncharacterized protein K0S65_333 [Labilithrix sp.]|nr:uncharacterized protein [Labilithrix sp.]
MKRAVSFCSILAVTAGLFVPGTAAADEPPPPLPPPAASEGVTATPSATTTIDNVHLRNGGLYRGRVTEIVPGDHVTVIVEKGETKRVPWAEVDRVIVASSALPPPPTAPVPGAAAPATAPLPAPMVGPRARVHIRASKSVILYRRPAGSSGWVQACTSPCNQELPIGDSYRITGNGVASSSEFRLDANPGGAVDLAVDPPSTGGMVGGGFLAGGGATAAYVGLLMALVGAAQSHDYNDCSFGTSTYCADRREDGEELRNAGLITMGVGAALTVGGLLIFIASAKTDISQSASGGGDSARAARPLDAFLHQPTWKSATSSSERAAAAPPAAFPVLFKGTF